MLMKDIQRQEHEPSKIAATFMTYSSRQQVKHCFVVFASVKLTLFNT